MKREGDVRYSLSLCGHRGLWPGIALLGWMLGTLAVAGGEATPVDTTADRVGQSLHTSAADIADPHSEHGELHSALATNSLAIADAWGIQILGLRLSGSDAMLDLRFRVLDPRKALPVTNPNRRPYLIDHTTGAKLLTPSPPKVGPQRRAIMVATPQTNQTYLILFSNSGRSVQPGNHMTLVIGDFRVQLTVEARDGGSG